MHCSDLRKQVQGFSTCKPSKVMEWTCAMHCHCSWSCNSHAKISGLLKEMLNAPGALQTSALRAGRRRRLGRIAAALFRGLAAVVTAPALAAVRVAAAAAAAAIV